MTTTYFTDKKAEALIFEYNEDISYSETQQNSPSTFRNLIGPFLTTQASLSVGIFSGLDMEVGYENAEATGG